MSTILHLLLALALTLFLAFQAGALVLVLRSRRALLVGRGRRRPAELVWTVIPVVLVLFLAARSWVVVLDLGRPAVASSVITAAPAPTPAAPTR